MIKFSHIPLQPGKKCATLVDEVSRAMPAAKYDAIYQSLRKSIETKEFLYGGSLPSEHQLAAQYGCSRNTVRRAVAQLAEEGYVQSVHGKGVLVIYHARAQTHFSIGGIESMKEAAARNGMALRTVVVHFATLTVDAALSEVTGFFEGEEVYSLLRVRYLDGKPLILDHNYFLTRVVRDLTPEIAAGSVYEYMEHTLGETVTSTRRRYTVERETQQDRKYLDLEDYNCLMVVTSKTFNREGTMFEFTVSRHRPDQFVFYEAAQRRRD